MRKEKPYVISKVNGARNEKGELVVADSTLWYCHRRDTPGIPVFGSIGSRGTALKYCRIWNKSMGY